MSQREGRCVLACRQAVSFGSCQTLWQGVCRKVCRCETTVLWVWDVPDVLKFGAAESIRGWEVSTLLESQPTRFPRFINSLYWDPRCAKNLATRGLEGHSFPQWDTVCDTLMPSNNPQYSTQRGSSQPSAVQKPDQVFQLAPRIPLKVKSLSCPLVMN
jgi:hypothetical protein